jgi:hypothetical protein
MTDDNGSKGQSGRTKPRDGPEEIYKIPGADQIGIGYGLPAAALTPLAPQIPTSNLQPPEDPEPVDPAEALYQEPDLVDPADEVDILEPDDVTPATEAEATLVQLPVQHLAEPAPMPEYSAAPVPRPEVEPQSTPTPQLTSQRPIPIPLPVSAPPVLPPVAPVSQPLSPIPTVAPAAPASEQVVPAPAAPVPRPQAPTLPTLPPRPASSEFAPATPQSVTGAVERSQAAPTVIDQAGLTQEMEAQPIIGDVTVSPDLRTAYDTTFASLGGTPSLEEVTAALVKEHDIKGDVRTVEELDRAYEVAKTRASGQFAEVLMFATYLSNAGLSQGESAIKNNYLETISVSVADAHLRPTLEMITPKLWKDLGSVATRSVTYGTGLHGLLRLFGEDLQSKEREHNIALTEIKGVSREQSYRLFEKLADIAEEHDTVVGSLATYAGIAKHILGNKEGTVEDIEAVYDFLKPEHVAKAGEDIVQKVKAIAKFYNHKDIGSSTLAETVAVMFSAQFYKDVYGEPATAEELAETIQGADPADLGTAPVPQVAPPLPPLPASSATPPPLPPASSTTPPPLPSPPEPTRADDGLGTYVTQLVDAGIAPTEITRGARTELGTIRAIVGDDSLESIIGIMTPSLWGNRTSIKSVAQMYGKGVYGLLKLFGNDLPTKNVTQNAALSSLQKIGGKESYKIFEAIARAAEEYGVGVVEKAIQAYSSIAMAIRDRKGTVDDIAAVYDFLDPTKVAAVAGEVCRYAKLTTVSKSGSYADSLCGVLGTYSRTYSEPSPSTDTTPTSGEPSPVADARAVINTEGLQTAKIQRPGFFKRNAKKIGYTLLGGIAVIGLGVGAAGLGLLGYNNRDKLAEYASEFAQDNTEQVTPTIEPSTPTPLEPTTQTDITINPKITINADVPNLWEQGYIQIRYHGEGKQFVDHMAKYENGKWHVSDGSQSKEFDKLEDVLSQVPTQANFAFDGNCTGIDYVVFNDQGKEQITRGVSYTNDCAPNLDEVIQTLTVAAYVGQAPHQQVVESVEDITSAEEPTPAEVVVVAPPVIDTAPEPFTPAEEPTPEVTAPSGAEDQYRKDISSYLTGTFYAHDDVRYCLENNASIGDDGPYFHKDRFGELTVSVMFKYKEDLDGEPGSINSREKLAFKIYGSGTHTTVYATQNGSLTGSGLKKLDADTRLEYIQLIERVLPSVLAKVDAKVVR